MDPVIVLVGLRADEMNTDEKNRLTRLNYGYESDRSWIYDVPHYSEMRHHWQYTSEPVNTDCADRSIYGIVIGGTWNGIIDISEPRVQKRIDAAIDRFREITGRDAHIIIRGLQT